MLFHLERERRLSLTMKLRQKVEASDIISSVWLSVLTSVHSTNFVLLQDNIDSRLAAPKIQV